MSRKQGQSNNGGHERSVRDYQFTPGSIEGAAWDDRELDLDFDESEEEANDWGTEISHFGKGPKGYKRSEESIREDVCETLAKNPRIDASEIEVTVKNSTVTLSGTVDTETAKNAAEIAIEKISGVEVVKNEIRIEEF